MEAAVDLDLDGVQQRVLGSLLEKERTVPDTYPMTLNGLRTACNQSSGRDPILHLSDAEVSAALTELRALGLTRVLHPSHGARQPKFRQVLDEVLRLEDGERAVVTLLLLRGPQTPGELRSRSDRLHAFSSLTEVEQALAALAGRERPLAEELPRQPGQKEQRWIHRLGPVATTAPVATAPSSTSAPGDQSAELEALRAQLAEARAEIERLRQELDDLTAP
jgi:uncharacterized protein YceH (UPF0502 family)